MDRHETQARIDAQINEWKNNLGTMKAKAEASSGDAKVGYKESVAGLEKQLDAFKIKAAAAWDVADDKWDSSSKDLESSWKDWESRAKKSWDDLVH
jgi:hypothetical protein